MLTDLHNKAIERLKELGADKERLWLVETQKLETTARHYGDYVIDDLARYSPDSHDSIIYYHESGSIHQHSTFNSNDMKSFNDAVEWIAKYLGAEVTTS